MLLLCCCFPALCVSVCDLQAPRFSRVSHPTDMAGLWGSVEPHHPPTRQRKLLLLFLISICIRINRRVCFSFIHDVAPFRASHIPMDENTTKKYIFHLPRPIMLCPRAGNYILMCLLVSIYVHDCASRNPYFLALCWISFGNVADSELVKLKLHFAVKENTMVLAAFGLNKSLVNLCWDGGSH